MIGQHCSCSLQLLVFLKLRQPFLPSTTWQHNLSPVSEQLNILCT